MKTVRVALAQIAPKLGDVRANLDLHLARARDARKAGARVVVFPELSLTGYLLRDQTPEVAVAPGAVPIKRLLTASRDIDIVFGFVEEAPGHRFYNAAAYLSRGRILHLHRKVYLPTYGLFEEGRDFAAGDRFRAFRSPFGPAGLLVCEDAWHPSAAWLLSQEGAELVVVLSSGPSRGARPGRGVTSVRVWNELLCVTARMQTSFVVFVNRVGYEDGLNFGGGSTVVDPFGRIVAELPPLDEGLAVAELDPELLRRARTAYPLLRDEDLELTWRETTRIRAARFDLPDAPGEAPARPKRSRRR